MDNIYGQTESERNSIADIPKGYAEKSGNTLYSWLGSLWRGLHKGDGMIRGLQSARGLRMAQMYLDVIEAARLQDRFGAPVFHRELWHPIVVRLSKRDTSQENLINIGMDGKVGAQPAGSIYGEGTVFLLGKLANLKEYATYPIDAKITGGAVSIVDNIINPTVMMERDKDFCIRNGSIIFHRDNDPLGDKSKFDRYDIPGLIDDDGNEVPDMEAVLWASDVLIDRNYIADHLSYALGANAPSSDAVKRIVNAAWSATSGGLTPELVRTLMAAMLNVPVIQHDRETVLDIYVEKDDDGNDVSKIVRTDMGAYRVSLKAKLRKGIMPGVTLDKGDFLDESVRIYPFLNKVSAKKVEEIPEGDAFGEWEFYPGEIDGLVAVPSSMAFSGGRWTAQYVNEEEGLRAVFNSDESAEDALSVDLYSEWADEVLHATATRDRSDTEPAYRTDIDASTPFSVPLESDIPSVVISASMIRARTEYGVYAMWGMEKVKRDSKGRLYFDIGGNESDVRAFWEDVWSRAKASGTDMESILGGFGNDISPAAFFLNNLVGANTLFVVVDRSQIDDVSMMRDPMFFDMLSAVVPSAIRLFLVERRDVGDGDVAYMDEASDACSVAAALPRAEDVATGAEELVSMRFFRPPPSHVRGKREEEKNEEI